MTWQDITISICLIFLSYALVPQIIAGYKEKESLITFQTSIITAIGMVILGITDITLGLYFSAIMSFIIGILWTILLIQNRIYN